MIISKSVFKIYIIHKKKTSQIYLLELIKILRRNIQGPIKPTKSLIFYKIASIYKIDYFQILSRVKSIVRNHLDIPTKNLFFKFIPCICTVIPPLDSFAVCNRILPVSSSQRITKTCFWPSPFLPIFHPAFIFCIRLHTQFLPRFFWFSFGISKSTSCDLYQYFSQDFCRILFSQVLCQITSRGFFFRGFPDLQLEFLAGFLRRSF